MEMEKIYDWNQVAVGGAQIAYSSNSIQQESSLNHRITSQIENAILNSSAPISISETEEITVNGQKGIWANKSESVNWLGPYPLANYLINEDTNPEIIRKKTDQLLTYQQEIAIRYLRPPTPPAPGDIVIKVEEDIVAPAPPPLIIRQQPHRPATPPPLVIREAPPKAPAPVSQKIITISSTKKLPPPPRKVVVERLPTMPAKPQSIIIERWLPYKQQKRKVIYVKSEQKDIGGQKNVVVQWETPNIRIIKDLGVVKANPTNYVNRYGNTLKKSMKLPNFVKEINSPFDVELAKYSPNKHHMSGLEGDLFASS